MGIVIFLGFIAPFAALITYAVRRHKKSILALAARNQWTYEKYDQALPNSFWGTPFQHGHHRGAQDILRGRFDGRSVLIFHYRWQVGSFDDESTYYIWVVSVEDLPAGLPALEVIRRRWSKHYASPQAGAEYRTGDPAFDKRFRVSTTHPQLAADVLDPDVRRLLMSWPDIPWRIEAPRLVMWGSRGMRLKEVEEAARKATTLATAVSARVRGGGGRPS